MIACHHQSLLASQRFNPCLAQWRLREVQSTSRPVLHATEFQIAPPQFRRLCGFLLRDLFRVGRIFHNRNRGCVNHAPIRTHQLIKSLSVADSPDELRAATSSQSHYCRWRGNALLRTVGNVRCSGVEAAALGHAARAAVIALSRSLRLAPD